MQPAAQQEPDAATVPQAPLPDEADIRRLVEAFYARVRHDPVLGPVFAGVLGEDDEAWARHMAVLCRFWSSVMLASGRYRGDPFSAHLQLDALDPSMFGRWLGVFEDTCATLFPAALADAFVAKARRIADSLRMGLFERLPTRRPRGQGQAGRAGA